ncbi:MAG: hypothetical protein U7127_05130 [Phormidium sp.]
MVVKQIEFSSSLVIEIDLRRETEYCYYVINTDRNQVIADDSNIPSLDEAEWMGIDRVKEILGIS